MRCPCKFVFSDDAVRCPEKFVITEGISVRCSVGFVGEEAITWVKWIKPFQSFTQEFWWNEIPPQTNTSSSSIKNCFQHTLYSYGALINPRGEHHAKNITPQTRPSRLHNTRLLIQASCISALAPRTTTSLFFVLPNARYTHTPT